MVPIVFSQSIATMGTIVQHCAKKLFLLARQSIYYS